MEQYYEVNIEEAITRLGLSRDFIDKLIKKFFESDMLTKADEAFAAKDLEEAKLQIHSIKGTSANLGFIGLHKLALDIETKMKEQQYFDTESFELMKKIWTELKVKYCN